MEGFKKGRGIKEQIYHKNTTTARSGIEIIEDDYEAGNLTQNITWQNAPDRPVAAILYTTLV